MANIPELWMVNYELGGAKRFGMLVGDFVYNACELHHGLCVDGEAFVKNVDTLRPLAVIMLASILQGASRATPVALDKVEKLEIVYNE